MTRENFRLKKKQRETAKENLALDLQEIMVIIIDNGRENSEFTPKN